LDTVAVSIFRYGAISAVELFWIIYFFPYI